MAEKKCSLYGEHLKRVHERNCKIETPSTRELCQLNKEVINSECSGNNNNNNQEIATNVSLLANTIQVLLFLGAGVGFVLQGMKRFIIWCRNPTECQPDLKPETTGPSIPDLKSEITGPSKPKPKPNLKPKSPKSSHRHRTTSSDNDEDAIKDDNENTN